MHLRFSCCLLVSIMAEAYSREQTLMVQKIASEHCGTDFVFAEEPEAKKELWKVRQMQMLTFLSKYVMDIFICTSRKKN